MCGAQRVKILAMEWPFGTGLRTPASLQTHAPRQVALLTVDHYCLLDGVSITHVVRQLQCILHR